jgi:hypothetical protein
MNMKNQDLHLAAPKWVEGTGRKVLWMIWMILVFI